MENLGKTPFMTRGTVTRKFEKKENKIQMTQKSKHEKYSAFYILVLVGELSRGRPEGSLFSRYYTKVLGRALLLSQDCSALPLIRTLYCWVLSKEVSSTIFKVFGMTRRGIEPRSPGSLANTLPTGLMSRYKSSQIQRNQLV